MCNSCRNDSRITVSKEHGGNLDQPWVARFDGSWLGSASTATDAEKLAFRWNHKRLAVLTP